MLAKLTAFLITAVARLVTGARALWLGCNAVPVQRLYYANHSSHGDFVLLWTCLPALLQQRTRPVAGKDYWHQSKLRRFLIDRVFNGVLVERSTPTEDKRNKLQPLLDALDTGDSLIIFPEGTRNLTDAPLLPFKSGIYHLSEARPDIEIVPVWISNLNRVMPKGRVLPLPLLCTLSFGEPLARIEGEDKELFLQRAQNALLALGEQEA